MKKVLTILIVISMTVVLLAACQSTPDKPIVIQKDMEQLIEKAVTEDDTQKGATLAESLNAPATYTTSFNGYNGDLTVNADAVVTIPNASGISVMRVSKHNFTQEEADKIMKAFLRGETLYQINQSLTKEEIEAELIKYYGMRDGSIPMNVDGENPNDEEKLQQIIKDYEKMLADAPAEKNLIPADTLFHTPEVQTANPDAKEIMGMATVNGKAAYLYINNGASGVNNIEATFINANAQLEGNYTVAPYKILSNEDIKEVKVPESFILKEAEAQNTAEDILTQFGITDMTCVDTRFAVMLDEITSGDADAGSADVTPEQLEKGKWAYSIQYQRTINGIPITKTSRSGNSSEDENTFSEPWPYELLEFIIDGTGVVYFHFVSPYNIQDTFTNNATLHQFSDITSVFEKMFPITFGHLDEDGTDYRLQVEIFEVQLGLMRVTEQNSRDTGLLIPVWDFFGSVIVLPDEGEPYSWDTNDSLITINAIDGSIIDRNLGY